MKAFKLTFMCVWVMASTFACTSTTTKKSMETAQSDKPQLIELLFWEKGENGTNEGVLASMRGFASEMNKYGTLRRKDIANNHGNWFSINHWDDEAAKERINSEAGKWESLGVFMGQINPPSFSLESYLPVYSAAEEALPGGVSSVVELVKMKKLPSVSDEDFAAYLHTLTPLLAADGGLQERIIGKNADGNWILINYWKNNYQRLATNAASANWPESANFGTYADPTSIQLISYFLRPVTPNEDEVIEVAVRAVKDGQMDEFVANRASFIKEWMANPGASVDREYESLYGVPNDGVPKYIGMTSWASQADFERAGQNPAVGKVAPGFMGTFDMLAFATAKPIEGDFNLAALIQNPGEILGLAVRRMKADESASFHDKRKAYMAELGKVPGVLATYELEVVSSPFGEDISIGMTVYKDQQAIDLANSTANQSEAAKAFTEVVEILTVNYLKSIK